MKQMRSLLDDEDMGERLESFMRVEVKHALLAASHNSGLLDLRLGAVPMSSVFAGVDSMPTDDLVSLRYRLSEANKALDRLYRELDRLQSGLGV
ncbi:MAG: hypothetical protein Q4P71_08995 [Actinomycetaceae bacterium]|nr:hypothetical protein [Actinomycetaceae bacterium]